MLVIREMGAKAISTFMALNKGAPTRLWSSWVDVDVTERSVDLQEAVTTARRDTVLENSLKRGDEGTTGSFGEMVEKHHCNQFCSCCIPE